MKNLFTVTLLALSLNTFAMETPCEKSERLTVELTETLIRLNINSSELDTLVLKVVSAVSENRDYKDVTNSMLLNKTITSDYYLTINMFFESFKQRMICEGKY